VFFVASSGIARPRHGWQFAKHPITHPDAINPHKRIRHMPAAHALPLVFHGAIHINANAITARRLEQIKIGKAFTNDFITWHGIADNTR